METVRLLRRLSEAAGVSGYEHQVRDIVRDEFARYADEVRTDALGSVIALKRGFAPERRPSIMLATHLDEIGLVVSQIEGSYLHFQQVGGYDDRVLLGQEVMVHGRQDLPGIIGGRPPHVLPREERDKPIASDKLLIDTGLLAEELAAEVRVGDLVTMNRPLVELQGDLVSGKALDNRASVVAAVLCLEALSQARHQWDVYAVATAQEEVGLKGAITSTFHLEPDLGIAIDVTFAKQPSTPEEYTHELGKGPTIGCGPNFHPGLQEALEAAAKGLEMSYDLEPTTRPGGTDAAAIQVSREGLPTGLISIPLRSMHTPVETVSIKDIERAGRLLAHFIASLDQDSLSRLTWDPYEDADKE